MKPILFSAGMSLAILDNTKTKTRRIIADIPEGVYRIDSDDGKTFFAAYGGTLGNALLDFSKPIKPKYVAGDVLWVREAWRVDAWHEEDGEINVQFRADGYSDPRRILIEDEELFNRLWIQSSDDAEKAGLEYNQDNGQYFWEDGQGPCRWRPSIYMPKEAARTFLRITSVGAEQLQDISEDDARAEGFMTREYFSKYWDRLNAARGYGWDENPWVWAYTFERITREEAMEASA